MDNEERTNKITEEITRLFSKYNVTPTDGIAYLTGMLAILLEIIFGGEIQNEDFARYIVKYVKRNKLLNETDKKNMSQV